VRLSKDQWWKYISAKHVEMAANFDLIGATVTNPDRITTQEVHREVFERMCDVAGYALPRRSFVDVVVEWKKRLHLPSQRADTSVVGYVVTAYTSGTRRRGEQTWPSAKSN